jgi:gluconolactonase
LQNPEQQQSLIKRSTKIPMIRKLYFIFVFSLLFVVIHGQELRELSVGRTDAIVDLKTREGAALVNTQWQSLPATIIPAKFKAPGASETDKLLLYPTGKQINSFNISPKFGTDEFNNAQWESVAATDLETRRGNGLQSHVWYRLKITVPEKIGKLNTAGTRIIFELVADDYSEVFINGKLNKSFGARNNGVIGGFNARQRVWLTDNAQPGQQFDIAILVTNGPIADIPDNYVWIRSATLDIYSQRPIRDDWKNLGRVIVIDKDISTVIDPTAKIEKLADGFEFTEGPVWHPDGFLLFSDPNQNVIYKYDTKLGNTSVYITKSGYTGTDIGEYGQPGSNGLAIDNEGRLVVAQHGNHAILRHEKKGPQTVLANSYNGKRLNSPNDLVIKSDNSIYFTDPPYGLPMAFNDPRKELPYSGVYRIKNGAAELLATDLKGPNGIAFSPDEKYLYVSNWDITDIHHTKTIWRYEVKADGILQNGKLFFEMNQTDDEEALDGLKVDTKGNIFASAPGGIWIINAEGKYLGKIVGPERPANMAWGEDGKTLYLTAHTGLYKIRTVNGGKIAH